MDKYYLYKFEDDINLKTIENLIDSFYSEKYFITALNAKEGYIIAGEKFATLVSEAVPTISSDLGTKLVILCTHANNEISQVALNHAFDNMSGFSFLSDVVMELLLTNYEATHKLILKEFDEVPRELILTASTYLKSGLNALRASEMLYVHRNTFNYRLNKFIELTNLDIRDYWNAFYFNLYMGTAQK